MLETVSGSVLGDNALEQIVLNVTGAQRLEMERTGSGAIAAIAFTPEEPTAVRLAAIRVTTEPDGAFGLVLALAGLLLVTMILLSRRVVD